MKSEQKILVCPDLGPVRVGNKVSNSWPFISSGVIADIQKWPVKGLNDGIHDFAEKNLVKMKRVKFLLFDGKLVNL